MSPAPAAGENMKVHLELATLLLVSLAGLPAAAWAGVCYQIVDRGDAIVYRSPVPPFPLSGPEFASGQRRLASAGRHLFWFDTTSCPEEDELRAAGPKPVAPEASALIQAPGWDTRPGSTAGTRAASGSGAASSRSAPAPAKSAPASGVGRKY